MQKYQAVALAVTLLAAAGCSKSPRDRLQGRWMGASIESAVGAPVEASATEWVRGTSLDFSGSKVTVTIPAESPRTGTFKVAKLDDQNVSVMFRRAEGGDDRAKMRFVGEQQLRWDIGSGREVVLIRYAN